MFRRFKEKVHKASKHSKTAAVGTSCLVIATLLVMGMLSMDKLDSQAANGTVPAAKSDSFWSYREFPQDMEIWQQMKVTANVKSNSNSKNLTYGEDKKDYITTTFGIPYVRDNEFSLNIESNTINSTHMTPDMKGIYPEKSAWQSTKSGANSVRMFYSYSSSATIYRDTYYRVAYEKSELKDWGSELFTEYRNKYSDRSRYAEDCMVTVADSYGQEFKYFAEQFLYKNGFTKYTNNAKIPMTQNGKALAGVQMVSVASRDLYYYVRSYGASSLLGVDLDFMVYTSHNYQFDYTSDKTPITLAEPTVMKEDGTELNASGITTLSKDDRIILKNDNTTEQQNAETQYYLSNSKTSNPNWTAYKGSIDPNGYRYLYVRNNYKNAGGQYIESSTKTYQLSYLPRASAFITANPITGSNVDVGTEITLTKQETSDTNAKIYYVPHEGNIPTLTKVTEEERKNLSGLSGYQELGGEIYVQANGIWYRSSSKNLKEYTGTFTPGDELRANNTMIVYAIVIENGRELGSFQKFQYGYRSLNQTAAPYSSIQTSVENPTSINMGKNIELNCSTVGSQIFYTTNGNVPVITQGGSGAKPSAGTNTYEYDPDQPIVVSEENANYGKTFVIMAQAVTYTEYNGKYYRANQDSSVVKFVYTVADQVPVEPVQSIPKTDTAAPVEVAVGSRIQLYSKTDNVVIYYTLDGSEPTFDENGEPTGETKKYESAEGVTVEKMQNSSLFTITAVAYKKGLAVSDITRLVFAYPGAVSSPYANPLPGAVEENAQVTLQTATKDAIIYYEIGRGSEIPKDPTTASKVFDASSPIVISEKTTIKAIAVKNSMESSVVTLEYTVTDKLSTPKPSIETGTVVASGTVITLKGDSGATIYYTLDGSDPKDAANKKVQVGSQVIINGKSGDLILLRTYAAKQGFSSSEEGTYSYSVSAYSGGIYADRESGSTVKNGDLIYLHTDMTDAKIYYTIDGSAPTTDSHCGSSVAISGEPGEQVTVMAMAVAEGSEKSTSFATFTYTIMEKVAAPTSSVPDGAIFTKQSVVELQAESGKIYYTTDESEPTVSSNLYKKNIVITQDVTIKAIAVAKDLETSEVSTFHYGFAEQVAAPIASYASGELEMGTKVTFTTTTEGATIYYRTDGKDINLAKKNELEIYKEPITINQATNFRVIAVKDQMQDSNVLKVGYTVKEPVVIEQADEEETQKLENQSNRLQSRRSFSETQSGPSFQDVILKNASYGAVVAAEEGTLPEQVQLTVESTNVTEAVNRRVKQVISDSYGVIASYDLTLLANGEEIEPDGTIEIGLPIPVEYENAMIYIIHVQDDGNIELYETRRSGGVAYAKVDHLSVYSITAPVEYEEEKATIPRLPIMYTLAVGLTGVGTWLIYRAKKEKREDGM